LNQDTGDVHDSGARQTLTKKEKQAAKHEALMERLGASHSPYSKSHNRRMKRKAREQLGTGLTELASALDLVAVDDASLLSVSMSTEDIIGQEKDRQKPTRTGVTGLITEGKGNPLSKHQRKQVLKTERLRQKLLQNAPEFTSNPFQAIRMHAQNTLVKHTVT